MKSKENDNFGNTKIPINVVPNMAHDLDKEIPF